jgi:hypothetical protein
MIIMKDLKRRIDRLGKASDEDFQAKARALSEQLGVPPERILAATRNSVEREDGISGIA